MMTLRARGRLLVALLLTAALVAGWVPAVLAAPAVRLLVNGAEVASDVPPQLLEGRTFVPLRVVTEALGAEVNWYQDLQTAEVRRGGAVISLVVGSNVAFVDGAPRPLDAPARIIDGRTMVPLRFLAEALGAVVSWDPAAAEVRVVLGAAPPAPPPGQPPGPPPSRSDMVAALLRANVVIVTDSGIQGSGFIVDPGGVVVTAYHVVEDAWSARVLLEDGRSLEVAGLLAASKPADLAVLQVTAGGLPTMPLGDSDAVRLADRVLALGNPLGLVGTVSEGIVSALRPETPLTSVPAFQVTVPVSPGSSGGALIDEGGRVVGVVFATVEGGQLLNFATPINYLKPLLAQAQPGHLPGGEPPAASSTASWGGGTADEFMDCSNAWVDCYDGVEEEYGRLQDRGASDSQLAALNERAVSELEPLGDALISAAPPGDWAPLHRATVKFQVAMLLTYEVFHRAYEARGDEQDELVEGGGEVIEAAEPWRRAANELGDELEYASPPPAQRGGATVAEFLRCTLAWVERYGALEEECVALLEEGAGESELAEFNERAASELEPLGDAVISAAPPGDYAEVHQLTVKFQTAMLLVYELYHRGQETADVERGNSLLAAGDEIIDIAEPWRQAMNDLMEGLDEP